jgi:valyl-tRNA synthetase
VDLVRAVRNARAEARIEPRAWLPVDVYVEPELGPALEALRPALERLARARPLRRQLAPEALHGPAAAGGLVVIAGPAEALVDVRADAADAGGADRARLEKELADAERLLAAAQARLANVAFTARAPAEIVEGARTRESELAELVGRLRARLRP